MHKKIDNLKLIIPLPKVRIPWFGPRHGKIFGDRRRKKPRTAKDDWKQGE